MIKTFKTRLPQPEFGAMGTRTMDASSAEIQTRNLGDSVNRWSLQIAIRKVSSMSLKQEPRL